MPGGQETRAENDKANPPVQHAQNNREGNGGSRAGFAVKSDPASEYSAVAHPAVRRVACACAASLRSVMKRTMPVVSSSSAAAAMAMDMRVQRLRLIASAHQA